MDQFAAVAPLLIGWCLDLILGDPSWLPHPIVGYGKAIGACERRFNNGNNRFSKGMFTAIGLIVSTYLITLLLLDFLSPYPIIRMIVVTIGVFYCLAGTTLIREVRAVFEAVDHSLEEGRKQVARIVGRDTGRLSAQEIRTAALETLAENLSDGVIAPLFWFALLGLPGMMAYKMVNTLDSMIGYRNDRYKDFGCAAARIDDVANYLPARITALLMVIASGRITLISKVRENGPLHASPNSGYPEAALAAILDCRFGGPHDYFGQEVYKPFIGDNPREISDHDLAISLNISRRSEVLAVILTAICRII
ncbi:MAG: adenosylcobinamide-phosphate synthase CbiB [Lachnoclostridium sp.]|nr:adenosylcobinamide-phosphate synthase CbiB [Lachnoclostridium sp.]